MHEQQQIIESSEAKASLQGRDDSSESATASVDEKLEPKKYTCDHPGCNLSFDVSKDHKIHIAQHRWGPHNVETKDDGSYIFTCLHPGCNKIMHDRKLLRKHLLTHREKQFACHYEGCEKRFYERAKLKRHYLVHTGEKPFECPYENCNKQFGYKANLKTHLRTHTGLRPFECTIDGCDRRFAQASNRNSHVMTHQKNTLEMVDEHSMDESGLMRSSTVVPILQGPPKRLKIEKAVRPAPLTTTFDPYGIMSNHCISSSNQHPTLVDAINVPSMAHLKSPKHRRFSIQQQLALLGKAPNPEKDMDIQQLKQFHQTNVKSPHFPMSSDLIAMLATPKGHETNLFPGLPLTPCLNLASARDQDFKIGDPANVFQKRNH